MSLSPTGYKLFAGIGICLGWWLKLIQVGGLPLRKNNVKLLNLQTIQKSITMKTCVSSQGLPCANKGL